MNRQYCYFQGWADLQLWASTVENDWEKTQPVQEGQRQSKVVEFVRQDSSSNPENLSAMRPRSGGDLQLT